MTMSALTISLLVALEDGRSVSEPLLSSFFRETLEYFVTIQSWRNQYGLFGKKPARSVIYQILHGEDFWPFIGFFAHIVCYRLISKRKTYSPILTLSKKSINSVRLKSICLDYAIYNLTFREVY